MRISSIPVLAEIENIYNDKVNASDARSKIKPGARNIIYVVKNLATYGGVETRLHSYAKALNGIGYNVIFVSERNRNRNIRDNHPCFHLNFHGRNFARSLVRLMTLCRAEIAEFHLKNRKHIRKDHIDQVKKLCRTGCLVHGELPGIDVGVLNSLDYRVLISDRLLSIDYRSLGTSLISPNAVAISGESPVWRYGGQREALIISRLKKDKFRQLQSAVEFCHARCIPFTIAGSPRSGTVARRLKKMYGLSDAAFTPTAIDTISYLAANASRYLFVAGVGQVILEAGSMGYPCLVVSDLGAPFCSFLTRHNIMRQDVFGRNMTIGHFKGRLQEVAVTEIITERIEDYDVSGIISEEFSLLRRVEEYVAHIEPGEKSVTR